MSMARLRVILPILSRYYSSEIYGLIVTLIALMNVISAMLGNVLNNIRLIYSPFESNTNCIIKDYNVILVCLSILNAIIITVFTYFYEGQFTFTNIIFIVL